MGDMKFAMIYPTLLVLYALVPGIKSAFCPDGWAQDKLDPSMCLHYIPTEATFNDAKKSCSHIGGDLVAPDGYIVTASVATHIQSEVAYDQKRNVWMDYKELAPGQNWTTANGSEIKTPPGWYVGYPEGDGKCGLFLYEVIQMKNRECDLRSAFLCRAKIESARGPIQTCPQPDLPEETMTYELVGTIKTGTYAYLRCEQDFKLSPTGHKKMFCGKNGRWNKKKEELAYCEREENSATTSSTLQPDQPTVVTVAMCDELEIGDLNAVMYDGGRAVGQNKTFICPPSSQLSSHTNINRMDILCNTDGVWEDMASGEIIRSVGVCEPKDVNDGVNSAQSITLFALPVYILTCYLLLFSYFSA